MNPKRLILVSTLFAILVAAVYVTAAYSQGKSPPVNAIGSAGVAIRGYDSVAYFTEGAPRMGKPEFATTYNGARWLFSTADHKALFESDPKKYAPAYGDYCAYGAASGYLVKIEPDAWAIRDGRLFLNYDRSVQKLWAASPDHFIKAADAKYPGLIATQ